MSKYKQDKVVHNLDELEKAQYGFYWRNKWYAKGFIISWQYNFLQGQISMGRLYTAVPTKDLN